MSTVIEKVTDIEICLDIVHDASDFIEHTFTYFIFLSFFIEIIASQRAFCTDTQQ
jgi:hypothetical protein